MAQVSTAVAKRTATAVKLVPLDDVVRAIHKKFAEAIDSDIKASKARLVAGVMLLDLRKRIDSGEAGDVSWWAWYEQKFVRTRKDAEN
jgi:hypothetical protein